MKFYNATAGNPKRVRIFLAEKAVDVPRVDLTAGKDTRTPEFRRLNSLGEVPLLELDDGRVITETLAICRYLESQFPDPRLMGTTAFEQAHIEMWTQRMQNQIFMPHGHYVCHTLPLFADVMEQVPALPRPKRGSYRTNGPGWMRKWPMAGNSSPATHSRSQISPAWRH